MRSLIFMLGLGGVVYGAYRYYVLQSDILYYSKITLADVKIVEKKADNVSINVKLAIKNDSEYDFTLKKYNLNVFINNKNVSNIQNSNVNERIAGNGQTSYIVLNIKFNPVQFGLIDVLSQLLKTFGKTLLTIKGDIDVQKGVLNIALPMELTYKLEDFA